MGPAVGGDEGATMGSCAEGPCAAMAQVSTANDSQNLIVTMKTRTAAEVRGG